jgi:hypothetical protein
MEIRVGRGNYRTTPSLILLDEIELALHSSALRRLVYFLEDVSKKYNFSIIFSTHSIELIRSLNPENIFYIQKHADESLEIIKPCYPVYATRNLESSNYGHDLIIMVEDNLAKMIVDNILSKKRLLGNKRVLVIAVGGWTEVIRFAYDTIRSNLALKTTKIVIILDRDIKDQVSGFMKNNNIGFSIPPNFLPIKSLEKYLLYNLTVKVDHELFSKLRDYVFQNKSLNDIVSAYLTDVKNGVCKNIDEVKNGKTFFGYIRQELHNMRKNDDVISNIIVEYLFEKENEQINELSIFLENTLDKL